MGLSCFQYYRACRERINSHIKDWQSVSTQDDMQKTNILVISPGLCWYQCYFDDDSSSILMIIWSLTACVST